MGNLAIRGGSPVREKPFVSWPIHGAEEREQVLKVVDSGNWWQFAYEENPDGEQSEVLLFQQEFAAYQGAEFGIACASGTAALEVLLKAMGIGPGDEVIVPSYTYIASASAVLMNQAVPVFTDIDPDTYNLDPDRLEEAITSRTRAIMPVHFAGQCCDMDAIGDIARKHSLMVIEDCAHAHGGEWNHVRCGHFGSGGTFSMQASKVMTAGEGGAITTDDARISELCESYIRSGRERGRPWYEFHRLGWNYRVTEFQGAILRVQLKRLDDQIALRNRNFQDFANRLLTVEGLSTMKILPGATRHSQHLIMLKYNPAVFGVGKETFVRALNAEGLLAQAGYLFPLYQNPMFLRQEFYGGRDGQSSDSGKKWHPDVDYAAYASLNPVCERACRDEAIWLNHRMFLGDQTDIDDLIAAIRKVAANLDELR